MAIRGNKLNNVKTLLEFNADLSVEGYSGSPLNLAKMCNNTEILRILTGDPCVCVCVCVCVCARARVCVYVCEGWLCVWLGIWA